MLLEDKHVAFELGDMAHSCFHDEAGCAVWLGTLRKGKLQPHWDAGKSVREALLCISHDIVLSSVSQVSLERDICLVLGPWAKMCWGLAFPIWPGVFSVQGRSSGPTFIHQRQALAKLACTPDCKGKPVPAPQQAPRNWLPCQAATLERLAFRNVAN